MGEGRMYVVCIVCFHWEKGKDPVFFFTRTAPPPFDPSDANATLENVLKKCFAQKKKMPWKKKPSALPSPTYSTLLSNHVFAPLLTHPHLMLPPCGDFDSRTHTERLPRRVLVSRVRDGQGAAPDEMGGETAVRVRWVMCISGKGVRERVRERALLQKPMSTHRSRRLSPPG